jgi:hypothetical protein
MVASGRSDLWEIGVPQPSWLRFIDWFVHRAAGKSREQTRKKPTSDSHEREKIASAWQQRLHGAPLILLLSDRWQENLEARTVAASEPCEATTAAQAVAP